VSVATTDFYGRTRELAELDRLLDRVLDGQTCTAFIAGEAGQGKSALVEAFVARAQARDAALVATLATCNSHTGQSDAYLPFLDTLAQLTGDSKRFKSGSISEMNAQRLEGFFEVAARAIVEDVPELIGQFIPGGSLIYHTISYTARKTGLMNKRSARKLQQQYEGKIEADKIFQLYADLLAKLSTHAPLVVVLEDLHWVDEASAQLLFSLSRRIVDAPILILGTYRPNDLAVGREDGRHPLVPVIHELKRVHGDVFIELSEETDAELEEFVTSLLEAEAPGLGPEFRSAFLAHTGGHALFARELLNSLRENGVIVPTESGEWEQARPVDWSDLPPRVEGVVEERIDRLDEELRDILTVASVQGETFIVDILAHLLDAQVRTVLRSLARKLERVHGLVHEVDSLRIARARIGRYRFSHALFQRYLYDGLGRAERRHLHADVAALLEAEYGDARADIATLLSFHFALAEEWERAVEYDLLAAQRAAAVSSYDTALDLMHQALGRLPELVPEDAAQHELTIRLELGSIHQALRGFTNPEAERNFRLAQEIAQGVDDPTRLALAMFGLWEYHLFRLELDRALEISEGIREIADATDDDVLRIVAHRAQANVAYQRGDMTATRIHADRVLEQYREERLGSYIHRLTYDPRVFALGMRAWAESLAGEVSTAEATLAEMFARADELDHPVSTCVAHLSALKLHYNLENLPAIAEHAAAMRELAQEYGLFWYDAFGLFFESWCAALRAETPPGAEAFAREFDYIYRTGVAPDGNLLIHSQYSRMLGEALLAFGAHEEAARVVAEGLRVAESSGELVYVADLLRILGEVQRARGEADEARSTLERAAAEAATRAQRLFERRARAALEAG
jgi:hypothetical protein